MKGKVVTFCILATIFSIFTSMVYAGGLDNFKQNKIYQNNFEDVNQNDWYYENVKIAYEKGLVNGTSEKTFNPRGNITAAETITLASRLYSTFMNDNYKFVANGIWYQPYVNYAIQNDIIEEGQFSDYNAKVTRAQFATVFAKALPSEALNAINVITSIPDVPKHVSYSSEVYKLYNAGILLGSDESGTFNPDNDIQRSEVAAIVTRMADASLRKQVTVNIEITDENIQGVWGYEDFIEFVFNSDNTFSISLNNSYEAGTYSLNGNVITFNGERYFCRMDDDYEALNRVPQNKTLTIDKLNSTTMHFESYGYDVSRKNSKEITEKVEKSFENMKDLDMEVTKKNIQGVWGYKDYMELVFYSDNTFSRSAIAEYEGELAYLYDYGTYLLNGNELTLDYKSESTTTGNGIYIVSEHEIETDKIGLNSEMLSIGFLNFNKKSSTVITEKSKSYFESIRGKIGTLEDKMKVIYVVSDIMLKVSHGISSSQRAIDYVSNDSQKAKEYAEEAYANITELKALAKQAIEICGNYEDMQNAKNKLNQIYKLMSNCEDSKNITNSNCSRIVKEYMDSLEKTNEYYEEIKIIEEKWLGK